MIENKLWYAAPAEDWNQALPLGNGKLGMMVFGGTAGIAEMLIQSHDGCIDLLPALPSAWSDGRFEGLMARGGFKVSAEWKDGRVISASVTGGEGKTYCLRFNGQTVEATENLNWKECRT